MIFIGLGSSIGNAKSIFDSVENALETLQIKVVKKSTILKNPPFGDVAKNEFSNAVWQIDTNNSPDQLLDILQKIEIDHGRTREKKWDDRTLDLDILMFGNTISNDEKLTIPHPGIAERMFVLKPWAEIVDVDFEVPGVEKVWEGLNKISNF